MLDIEDADGIRTLRLAHGKANALDIELVRALTRAVDASIADKVRALVLTGTGGIFCAGVDLIRLASGGAAYLAEFMPAFDEMTMRLFAAELPVIAAANGHAIAGGAVLMAAADYRLMALGDGRFGYTELAVGLPFPLPSLEIVRYATPSQALPDLLYGAGTVEAAQAKARGLIDEAVGANALMEKALATARRYAAVPRAAFADTKRQLRGPALARMRTAAPAASAAVLRAWSAPETLAAVRAYVERTLKKR